MASVLPIVSGVTGLISGLSGNSSARKQAGRGAALQDAASSRLMQIAESMMGLAGGRGRHAFDVDRQYAQVDAADRRAEADETRSGVAQLVGAGYKPGDSAMSRVATAIGERHKVNRDQMRGDIERQNTIAQSQLYAMPAGVLNSIYGQGTNLYNQGQQNIKNPSGLLSSGFLDAISGVLGKKKSAPTAYTGVTNNWG